MDALLDHPDVNFIVGETENDFGIKRIVECNIPTPDGRNPCIRTVWLREHGDDVHRLVTAIPLRPR